MPSFISRHWNASFRLLNSIAVWNCSPPDAQAAFPSRSIFSSVMRGQTACLR
jgi:hypothetical protein